MSDLHDLTLLEQAAAVRDKSVSPVELVEHYLARIDKLSDTVGAFVTVTADSALEAARAAEQAVAAGVSDLPALHGVPTAIKDLNLVAGVITRFGTSAMPGIDLGIDDAVTTKLKAAGLISLGKTNTPEFGLPCYTEPDVAPPARTPWDLSRSAGGSSGGAAAAVAAGLVAAAQGSDGGGSIRIPASVCGLFGVKPSRGRVSNAPVSSEISGLAVNGPLAPGPNASATRSFGTAVSRASRSRSPSSRPYATEWPRENPWATRTGSAGRRAAQPFSCSYAGRVRKST